MVVPFLATVAKVAFVKQGRQRRQHVEVVVVVEQVDGGSTIQE